MPHTRDATPSAYTRDHDRPSKRDRLWNYLRSDLKFRDALLAMIALVLALGWTVSSPAKQIAQLRAADSAQDQRIATNEKTIASLVDQQRFTNYLLCVQIRRTDPTSAPPDCIPIIDARKPK